MNLKELKNILPTIDKVTFRLENGTPIPEHVHVTEVGLLTKHFIDCGGMIRNEKVINFQLWYANDIDHRLLPIKLLDIILLSEEKLQLENAAIEIEYQTDTIGKYGLTFENNMFVLTNKMTNCLDKNSCGISPELLPETKTSCCTPGGGCC